MRTTVFLILLMLKMSNVQAQKPILLAEDSVVHGTGRYPGLTVTIPEVGYDRTVKNWIRELQSGTRSRMVTERGDMSIFGANIRDISANPMNIYSKVVSQDTAVQLQVIFELKKDQYISKANGDAELLAAREYLREFAKNQYIDLIRDEVAYEEKQLRDLNFELNSLMNAKMRMERSIQSNRTLITEMKDNIALKNEELARVSSELITENSQLTSMDEGSAKEKKKSKIKELERHKKRILNEIESSENRIKRAETDISEAERNIPQNNVNQRDLRTKIAKQEEVVKKFQNKLNTVKAY